MTLRVARLQLCERLAQRLAWQYLHEAILCLLGVGRTMPDNVDTGTTLPCALTAYPQHIEMK